MRIFILLIILILSLPSTTYAQTSNPQIEEFTSGTISTLSIIATLVSAFFLIKGGYLYITSTGKPEALENAKITIRNALIGLVLVLSANIFISVLTTSFTTPSQEFTSQQIELAPIATPQSGDGLSQVLTEAIANFLQNIIVSATKPLTDGIVSFLTTTPSVVQNREIFNFWLIIVGITNALFALVVAVIGLQFMSASTFGFEEMELKQILPRIGLAFLGANVSIFLVDWIVQSANVLTSAVLSSTGGLNDAWITNIFNPAFMNTDNVALITLIFGVIFIILTIFLLLFYVSRLIFIALAAVISPLIFLIWAVPRFSDFAEISTKTFITTVYIVFIHVVIIQLAAAFLVIQTGDTNTNNLIGVLTGVGLIFTLIKTQSILYQMIFYNSGRASIKKMGGQIINVMQVKQSQTKTIQPTHVKIPRKMINV